MDTVKRLSRVFLDLHPQDAARVLESFGHAEMASAMAGFAPKSSANILGRMVPPRAADCLSAMADDKAAAIVGALATVSAAAVLRRMKSEHQERLLSRLAPEQRDVLQRLLRYPEGTAGSLMDPRAFALPDDITVAEARRRVQKAGRRVQYYLYVLDRERRLVGVLNLRDFMLAKSRDTIGSLMKPNVVRIPAIMTLDQIVQNPSWKRFLSLPVVDTGDVFVGALEQKVLRPLASELDKRPEQAVLATCMAIGELYWAGLAGAFGGRPVDRAAPGKTPSGGRDAH